MRTEDERERGFEAQMRQTLRAITADSSSACVDAEAFAAWSEGALPPAQARTIEAHVASCARCAAMLASFAQADLSPAVTSDAAVPFWRRWRLQWLVPIAATATAIAVWVAAPSQRRPPSVALSTARAPVEIAPDLAVVAPPPANAEGLRRERAPAELDARPSGALAEQRAEPQLQKGLATTALPQRADRLGPPSAPRLDDSTTAKLEAAQTAAASAAAAGPTSSPALTPSPAPPAAPAAEAQLRVANDASARDVRTGGTLTRLADILSPDPNFRWRAIAGGQVQFSTTAGRLWTPAPVTGGGGAADITAGSAPNPQTCWLVGRAGVVMLSSDGRSFRRLDFPASVDLTAIKADDARRATVMTADGRTYATADGGGTWTTP